MVDREKVVRALECCILRDPDDHARCSQCSYGSNCVNRLKMDALALLKAQEADKSKYEYHTDHTDCPWYISGEESKCPVTCSQYRDGWNDAMDYIYKGGNGYRPYKRR